jgi:hypothetical protein
MAGLPARVVTAEGVLLKDWGESTAVVFVTATAATHLLTAQAAGILARCRTAAEAASLDADADTLQALLAAGLLQPAA